MRLPSKNHRNADPKRHALRRFGQGAFIAAFSLR
jgi:hypothetical protein